MITIALAAIAIMAGYFVGLKLEKSTARIAMALLISVPYIVWASPFWMPLGHLEGGDAGMAIGFLFLLLFPYAAYGATRIGRISVWKIKQG